MRVTALLLVLLFVSVASPSASRAEKVKANQPTDLLNRPGERGKVLMQVKEGQGMTVVAKQGRWLKVRVAGRTGFVPRSKVDVSTEIARNTRRRAFVDGRSTQRGFGAGAAPEDRVGADALGDGARGDEDEEADDAPMNRNRRGEPPKPAAKPAAKPAKPAAKPAAKPSDDEDEVVVDDEESEDAEPSDDEEDTPKSGTKKVAAADEPEDERRTARVKSKTIALSEPEEGAEASFQATPATVLYPTGETKGKYTEVENDEGELGYVLTSKLDGGSSGPVGPRAREMDANVRLGITLLSQKTRTSGGPSGLPDNYDLGTSAVTFALGGGVTYPYKAKFVVGGELGYAYAKAIPGVTNEGGTTTSVSLHHLRLRGLFGYDLRKASGLTVFGRLGLHYQSYQVANVEDLSKNLSRLPSEIITAPSLGVGVAMPRLTKKIGLKLDIDTILVGASVKQTKNLEDGTSPSATGAVIAAGMTYRWRKNMDISAAYELSILSMSYGPASMESKRAHMGTGEVTRGDTFHALTVGVAKGF